LLSVPPPWIALLPALPEISVKQIRGWRILRHDVPVAFEPPVAAAHDHRGWIVPVVRVAVATKEGEGTPPDHAVLYWGSGMSLRLLDGSRANARDSKW